MLQTLEKMSGTTHKSYIDQKTVTRDMEKLVMANEGKASYMMQTKEVPVISYNDMAFIAERNSIVFRAGDAPIWNRNETILPMSWRLFSNTIEQPGQKFTLQTIPTLSSAIDFDLKKNQPDFDELLRTRMEQAALADAAAEAYKNAFQYDDDDIHRLDVDVYAGDVMTMVNAQMQRNKNNTSAAGETYGDEDEYWDAEANEEALRETEALMADKNDRDKKIFAHGSISRSDLITKTGEAIRRFDAQFAAAYQKYKADFANCPLFHLTPNGYLCSADGSQTFIYPESKADAERLRAASEDPASNVYSEELSDEDLENLVSYHINDEFYQFLAGLDTWAMICNGKFEDMIAELVAG